MSLPIQPASDRPVCVPDGKEQLLLNDLYSRYAECLADGELESWPDFFDDECVYQIKSRLNWELGLPVALMLTESRGGLIDRVTAIRNTVVFAPRTVLPAFHGVRATHRDGASLSARTTFTVHHTLGEGTTTLLLAGRTFDRIDIGGDRWRFAARMVVYDNDLLPSTIVYPV